MFSSGHIVLKHYRIDRLIGIGGMGLIFRAEDTRSGAQVAIKVLRPSADLNDRDVRRFHREARLLAQLSHPNVLNVMEVGTLENGLPVLVMDLLEGRDLRQEIRVRDRFPVDEAVGYVMQATAAVAAVHAAGMIHRDIKPQNLFITRLTGARHLKLLDFGISKSTELSEATLTATQGTLGTPQYMSPEQIFGARDVDTRTDIWALGIILYFLLAGELPFTGPTPGAVIALIPNTEPRPLQEFRSDLPRDLINIVERCLRKDPDERFATAEELLDALEPFGPESGEIFAPAVDVPSTIPPIAIKDQFNYLPSIPKAAPLPSEDGLRPSEGTLKIAVVPAQPHPNHPASAAHRSPVVDLLDLVPVEGISIEQRSEVPDEVTVPSSRRLSSLPAAQQGTRKPQLKRQLLFFMLGGTAALLVAYFSVRAGMQRNSPAMNSLEMEAEPTTAPDASSQSQGPAATDSPAQPTSQAQEKASPGQDGPEPAAGVPPKTNAEAPAGPAGQSDGVVAPPTASPSTTGPTSGPRPTPRAPASTTPAPAPSQPKPAPAPKQAEAPPLYL